MDQKSGSDDTLGFVRGLDLDTVQVVAAQSGCDIAIINPRQLFVVGGTREKVTRMCSDALKAGAMHSGLANPFDPVWTTYFARRRTAKRSVKLFGATPWC